MPLFQVVVVAQQNPMKHFSQCRRRRRSLLRFQQRLRMYPLKYSQRFFTLISRPFGRHRPPFCCSHYPRSLCDEGFINISTCAKRRPYFVAATRRKFYSIQQLIRRLLLLVAQNIPISVTSCRRINGLAEADAVARRRKNTVFPLLSPFTPDSDDVYHGGCEMTEEALATSSSPLLSLMSLLPMLGYAPSDRCPLCGSQFIAVPDDPPAVADGRNLLLPML